MRRRSPGVSSEDARLVARLRAASSNVSVATACTRLAPDPSHADEDVRDVVLPQSFKRLVPAVAVDEAADQLVQFDERRRSPVTQ